MNDQARGWVEILSANDSEAVWAKLFKLVSRHSSIRNLLDPRSVAQRPHDLSIDITQDLFLRLHRKKRWQHYMEAGYQNTEIDHELYHIEIPNLVSLFLRERHPEAYRMARRISNLVQHRPEFRIYSRQLATHKNHPQGKMSLRVYGLREWPDDKPFRPYQGMRREIDDVCCRVRDRRRAGRGGDSHIIISNNDLIKLLVEIFRAIDSPADVRIMRSLVLSKLPVEDSRFLSIEAALTPEGPAPKPTQVDFADQRPTPEEILLDNESMQQIEILSVELLEKMRSAVRNKPNRYSRLARVAWHCYFDDSSPSQTSIARMIGISNSLVSHYRKLFDEVVRNVNLDAGQYVPFLHSFSAILEKSIKETVNARDDRKETLDSAWSAPNRCTVLRMTASAGAF
jgi:hypothetical protein